MNCDALAEIILDMARGAAVPEAARLGVRRHMEACASCAAEYGRQRELTTALQGLAAEAQDWSAPAAMEQRLLSAFAARQGRALPVRTGAVMLRWRYALATAAVVILAVWGIRQAGEPTNRGTGQQAGTGAAGVGAAGGATAARPRLSAPPAVSERVDHASRTAAPPAVSKRVDRASRTATPPAVSERVDRASRTASPVEFVRIPSAIGLPELESGTVLRMELPLTALPEYGLDIAPDAMRTSVEADVLVGQDGQPRAIRLVGIPDGVGQDSRIRQ
jgi:hypothetical protein